MTTRKQSMEEQKKNSNQNLAIKSEPTEGDIKTTVEPSNNSDVDITKALGHDRKHTMLGVTASEMYKGSGVNGHELFLYVLFTVLSAYVCYLHFQLRGFERKFEEINSHIDYLEMLKQIKAAVPEIQQKISSSNEQTGTALIRVKELEDWANLAEKRLNDTEAAIALATADMRTIETKSTAISNSNDKLKSELENESKNIESFKDKVKGLELESIQKLISELKERTDDAESVLIPSIEKQKALVNSIKEFEDISKRVSTIKDELSIAEQKMTKLKEYNNSIQSRSVMIEKGENFTKQFIEQTLTGLIARVESHIRNGNIDKFL